MLFMVLYQVSDNYIGVHQPSFCAHRMLARRATFAAASRVSSKFILFPLLLANSPFSARVPGCTRIVAWSPSTAYWSLSPGLICSALRIFPGIVVCAFLVTVEWGMNRSLLYTCSLQFNHALPGHSLARSLEESSHATTCLSLKPPPRWRRYEMTSSARSRGYLPHLETQEAIYFVTFRLADSLPRELVLQLRKERDTIDKASLAGNTRPGDLSRLRELRALLKK